MTNNPLCQRLDLAAPVYGKMKRIRVYLFDEPDTCNVLNINPRNCRNWTEILKHITETIKPAFGAVLRLYELASDKFVETFDELILNETYIDKHVLNAYLTVVIRNRTSRYFMTEHQRLTPAKNNNIGVYNSKIAIGADNKTVGTGHFRALGAYGTVKKEPGMYTLSNKKDNFKPRERTQLYLGEIDPRMLDFLNETEKKGLTVIYVMTNGVSLQVPQKVVFRKHELQNWDPIIRFLDQKLDIPEGVEHISTIFGDILLEPRELQHGFVYVAIQPLKPFIELDYLELFKYLCSNYRGNYVLSIEPAPIQTSELVRRRTISEPHPSLRMSEFDIEPRKSRASERKLSTFSKRGNTRDSSVVPKRASTPDKRPTTTSNRMRSLNKSIPTNKKNSSDSLGSRMSTISQTEDNPGKKSVQSTGRQPSARIPEIKINPSKNKSKASIASKVSYESKKGRSTSKLGSFLPEKGPQDEWEDELADLYPMESTVEDRTRSRVSKTRASQTAKHSKSSGILNEDIVSIRESPIRKATIVITNDIDDNESDHVKPSMYRRGTKYVIPQPRQSVNKPPTSCPVFRDCDCSNDLETSSTSITPTTDQLSSRPILRDCDCPEKELDPMLVTSDNNPRRSKAPTSCPVFRNCDCTDESDTNSISAAASDTKQRRSMSKSIISKISEKKLNKAESIASARGDENRASRSNRRSCSTVRIESDEDSSDPDSVNKEERTTQISRKSQISKGDFRQSISRLSNPIYAEENVASSESDTTEGFYIDAATSNNRPSENSPAYCPTYKDCDCSNISDDFATQTDSRNRSKYPTYQSFSFECNCPEDTVDPILESCSENPGQKITRASTTSRQPDEGKRRSTKSRQSRRKSSKPKSYSSKKRKQSTKQLEESLSDLEIIQTEYNAPDIYDETTEDVDTPDNIIFDYNFDKDINKRDTSQSVRRASRKFPEPPDNNDFDESVILTNIPSQISKSRRSVSKYSTLNIPTENYEDNTEQTDTRRSTIMSRSFAADQPLEEPELIEYPEQITDSIRSIMRPRPSQISQAKNRSSKILAPTLHIASDEDDYNTEKLGGRSSSKRTTVKSTRRSSCKTPIDDENAGSRRSIIKPRKSLANNDQDKLPAFSVSIKNCKCDDIAEQMQDTRRSTAKAKGRKSSSPSPDETNKQMVKAEFGTIISMPSELSSIMQVANYENIGDVNIREKISSYDSVLNGAEASIVISRPSMISQTQRRSITSKPRPSQILQDQRRRSSKSPAALEREDMEQGDESRRSVFKSRPSQILQDQRRRSSKSPAALEREDIEQDQSRRSVFKSRPSQILQEQGRKSRKSPAALDREDIEQGDESRRSVFESRPSRILQEQRRRSSKSPAALEREDMEQGDESRRSVFKSKPSQILQDQRRRSSKSPAALEREDIEQGDESRRSVFKSRPSQILQDQRRKCSKSPAALEREDIEQGDESRRSVFKSRPSQILQDQRRRSSKSPAALEREDIEQGDESRRSVFKSRPSQILQDQRRKCSKSPAALEREDIEQGDESRRSVFKSRPSQILQDQRCRSSKSPAALEREDIEQGDESRRSVFKSRPSQILQDQRRKCSKSPAALEREDIEQGDESRRSVFKSRPSQILQDQRRRSSKSPAALEREDIEQGDESRRSVFKSKPSQILQEQKRRSSKSPAALEREDMEQGDESRRSVFKSKPSQILQDQRRRSSKSPAALDREDIEQGDESRRSVFKSRPSQILQEQKRRSSKSPAALEREDMEQGDESRRSVFKSKPSQILQEEKRRSSKSPAALEREDMEQGDESRRSVFKSKPSQILQDQRRRSSKSPAALEREDMEQGDESRRSVFKSRPSQILQDQRRRSSKSPAALEREDIEQGDESRRSVFKSKPSQILQEQKRRSSKSPAALEHGDMEQGDESRRSVFKSRPSQILQDQRRRSSKSPAALEREDIEQGDESRRSVFKSKPSQILQEQKRRSSKSPAALEREDIEQGDESRRNVFKSRPSQILQDQRRRSSKSPAALEREDIEQGDESRRSVFKSRPSQILQEQRRRSSKSPAALEREDMEQGDESRRSVFKSRPSQISQAQRRSMNLPPISIPSIENDDFEEGLIQTDALRRSTCKSEKRSRSKSPVTSISLDEYECNEETKPAPDTRRSTTKSRLSGISQAKKLSSYVTPISSLLPDNNGYDNIMEQTSRSPNSTLTSKREFYYDCECNNNTEKPVDKRRNTNKFRKSQILQDQRRSIRKSLVSGLPLENDEIEEEILQTDTTSTIKPKRRSSCKPPAIDDFSDEYEPKLDTNKMDSTKQSIKFRQSLLSQTKRPSSTAAAFFPNLENMDQTPRSTNSTSLSTGGSVDDYGINETGGSRRSITKSRPSIVSQTSRRSTNKVPVSRLSVLERVDIEQGDETGRSISKTRPSQILQEQKRRSSKSPAALDREDIEQGDESRRSVFKSRPSQILQDQRRRSSKSPAAIEREDIEQGDESRRSVFKSRPSQILQEQKRKSSKSPATLEREDMEQGDESRRSVFKSRPSQILQEQRRRSSKSPAALELDDIEQGDESRRRVFKSRPSQILQEQRRRISKSPAALEHEDMDQRDEIRRSVYKTRPSQILEDQRRKSSKSPASALLPDDYEFDIDSIGTEETVDSRRTTIKSRQSQISQAKRLSCKIALPFSSPIENRDSGDITSNTSNSSSSPSANSDESGFHGDTEQATDSRRNIIKTRTSQISQGQRRSTNKVPIYRFPAENEDGSDGKSLAIDDFRNEDTSTRRSTNKSQIIKDPTRRLSKSPNSKLFCDSISRHSTVQSQPNFVSNNLQCYCLSDKSLVPPNNYECIENISKIDRDSYNSQLSNSTPNCSTDIIESQRRGVVTFCSSNISQNPERDCSNVFASSCNNNDSISPINHMSQISINKCPNFADPSPLQDYECDYTGGRTDNKPKRRSSKRNSSQDSYNKYPATCPVPIERPGGSTNQIASSGSIFQACNCAENAYNISPSLSEELDFVTRKCVDKRQNNDCHCAEDQAVNLCCNQLKKITDVDKSASCPLVSFTIFCKDQWSSKSSEVGICPCQTNTSISNQNEPSQNQSCCCSLPTNENRPANTEICCINKQQTSNRNQCCKFRNTNQNQQISPCFKSHNELWYCLNQDEDNKCTKSINFCKQDDKTICKCNQRLSNSQNSICPNQTLSCFCCKCQNEKLTCPEKTCKPLCSQDIVLKLQFSCNKQEKKAVQKVEPISCNCKEIPIVSGSQEELEPEPEPEFEPEFEEEPEPELEEEPEPELEEEPEPELEEPEPELEQELDLEPEPEPKEDPEIEMEPEFEELEPELDEEPKFESQRISNKGPMPAMTTSRAYVKTVTKTSCTCCRRLCCGCNVRYFKCGW